MLSVNLSRPCLCSQRRTSKVLGMNVPCKPGSWALPGLVSFDRFLSVTTVGSSLSVPGSPVFEQVPSCSSSSWSTNEPRLTNVVIGFGDGVFCVRGGAVTRC